MRRRRPVLTGEAPSMELAAAQTQVHGEGRAFGLLAEQWLGWLRLVAESIVPEDEQLAQDMAQEALIQRWEEHPSRFGPGDTAYLCQVLESKMRDVARRERPMRIQVPKADDPVLRPFVRQAAAVRREEGVNPIEAMIR